MTKEEIYNNDDELIEVKEYIYQNNGMIKNLYSTQKERIKLIYACIMMKLNTIPLEIGLRGLMMTVGYMVENRILSRNVSMKKNICLLVFVMGLCSCGNKSNDNNSLIDVDNINLVDSILVIVRNINLLLVRLIMKMKIALL